MATAKRKGRGGSGARGNDADRVGQGPAPNPCPEQEPIPAYLAVRVAEAADGVRDGEVHYFLINEELPYEVRDFPDCPSAEAARRDSPVPARVVGPYRTPKDPFKIDKVGVDSVHVHLKDGTCHVINGDQADCLFWTVPALDKFLLPYYTAVYSAEIAGTMRILYMDHEPRSAVLHDPFSNPKPVGVVSSEALVNRALELYLQQL